MKDLFSWSMFWVALAVAMTIALLFSSVRCESATSPGPGPDSDPGPDSSPDPDSNDGPRWNEIPNHPADADIDTGGPLPADTGPGPGDSGDGAPPSDATTEADSDSSGAIVGCRTDDECHGSEAYCHPQAWVCYDGVAIRCDTDADCPIGLGECSDGGECSEPADHRQECQ